MEDKNETFEKNIAVISSRFGILADEILAHDSKDCDFMLSLNENIVMTYQGMPLHNMEDPIHEAKAIYDSVNNKEFDSTNIIFGLGLGYLFKRATMECKGTIILYEPNLDILRKTLEVVDFAKEFEMPNVFLCTHIKYLRPIFMNVFYQGDKVGIQMLTSYRLYFPQQLTELRTSMEDFYRDTTINQHTVLKKARDWSLSSLHNIFDVLRAPNMASLKDRFKDIPAIIVSAGPSLDLIIEDLKKVQDKVLIISVGQALKSLDKAGIKPHIVMVIENLNVSQQFENVSYLKDLTIACQPMTHRSIYQLPAKRFIINFPISDSLISWFGEVANRDIAGFQNRGTVSICAFYLAMNAGCNPLILAGQDLAFKDGNRYASNSSYDKLKYEEGSDGKMVATYAEGAYDEIGRSFGMTKEEFEERNRITERELVKVKGWNGEDLYSTISYSVFINNFTDIANLETSKTGQRIINTSEKGAFIKALDHMPFKKAMEESNLEHGKDLNKELDDFYASFKVEKKSFFSLYNAMDKCKKDMGTVNSLAKEALIISKKILSELKSVKVKANFVDKQLGKLGAYDQKIITYVKEHSLINPFIQQALFDYSKSYNRSSRHEDEKDKIQNLKSNIEASIKLYDAVIYGSEEVESILCEVLEENTDLISSLTE